MKYIEIVKIGIRVSQPSFGASSLDGVSHDIDRNKAIEAVHVAVDGSMNFIHVPSCYRHYNAKEVLSGTLR